MFPVVIKSQLFFQKIKNCVSFNYNSLDSNSFRGPARCQFHTQGKHAVRKHRGFQRVVCLWRELWPHGRKISQYSECRWHRDLSLFLWSCSQHRWVFYCLQSSLKLKVYSFSLHFLVIVECVVKCVCRKSNCLTGHIYVYLEKIPVHKDPLPIKTTFCVSFKQSFYAGLTVLFVMSFGKASIYICHFFFFRN